MTHFENQTEKIRHFVQFFYRLQTIRLSKTIKNPCKNFRSKKLTKRGTGPPPPPPRGREYSPAFRKPPLGEVWRGSLYFFPFFVAHFKKTHYICPSNEAITSNNSNMIDVKATLSEADERMDMAAIYLDESLNRIRAGRANAAILDGVRVESYGSKVPLNQVANVTCPDARTIAIRPWDRKAIRDIEKAIMDSDVGITPENNGEIIRLNIPQPTEERRRELTKQCNKIAEKAKVEVRNVRADIKERLKKAIKDGLSEDNEKDAELELQKIHDRFMKKIDALIEAKNKEIMTV